MAERYGGKFSPEPKPDADESKPNAWRGQKRTIAGGRSNFLFLAPLPLAIRAFMQDPTGLALTLLALGVLLLAAWLTREGLLAQEAFEARKIARRPAFPRKIAGSLLTGIGIVLATWLSGNMWTSLILGAVGAILHSFAFGLDPLRNKGMEGVDTFQQDRVARAVGEAEKHLKTMKEAVERAGDRQIETRVAQFQEAARDMFRTVEEDPRDLTAARKYLGVYLMGARDAAIKFSDVYSRTRDKKVRADFSALLDDLERNFSARTEALLNDNKSDLNIEIEVLRERLAREGVRTEST